MAIDFNGSTDRIDWVTPYNHGGNAWSASVWVYLDITSASQYVFTGQFNTNANRAFLIWINSSDYLNTFQDDTGDGQYQNRASGDTVSSGSWFNFISTWDGTWGDATTMHIYKDGVEVSSYSSSQNGTGTAASSDSDFSVGGRISDDLRNLDGKLAEVALWNRELTSGEITGLATGYAPIFFSNGLKFYSTLMNKNDSNCKITGTAAVFDGCSNYSHPPIIYPVPAFYSIPTATAGGNAPTGGIYGPLFGPFGGPI